MFSPVHRSSRVSASGDVAFKALIVGDAGVGKSTLVNRWADDSSRSSVDYTLIHARVHVNKAEVQLWECSRQERCNRLPSVYFRGARAAYVVCDATRHEALESAIMWKAQLDKYCEGIFMYLLINKWDLLDETARLKYSEKDMWKFCDEHGFTHWYHVSAHTGENADYPLMKSCYDVVNSQTSILTRLGLPTFVDEKGSCTC